MKNIFMAFLFTVLSASQLHAFNIDPKSVDLKLKSGEKKEVVIRIKNIYNFGVTVNSSVTAKKEGNSWITKLVPAKFKLDAGGYTYANAYISVPVKAAGADKEEIVFQVSGTGKNSKFSQDVVLPVSIAARNADTNAPKSSQAKPK
jgi:hypothetical protein